MVIEADIRPATQCTGQQSRQQVNVLLQAKARAATDDPPVRCRAAGHPVHASILEESDMSIAHRTAETTWEGSLAAGGGAIRSGSDGLDVTWAARIETPGGKTGPEELAAAAHSC
jgi:hypothetical protein